MRALQMAFWCSLAALAAPGRTRAQAQPPADLVLINGTILTVDANDSVAQAVAIAGGKIVAVGSNDAIRARIGAANAGDRSARPHGHARPDRHARAFLRSRRALLGRAQRRRVASPTCWRGCATRWPGPSRANGCAAAAGTRASLRSGATSPPPTSTRSRRTIPVWLMHTTGHYGVANSYALKMAEVTAATTAPPAGTIDRDAQGNPTGVLKESAMGLVSRNVPPLTREQQRAGIIRIIEDFNKEGDDRREGSRHRPGEVGALPGAAEGRASSPCACSRCGPARGGSRTARQVLARVNANPRPPASLGDGVLISGGVKMFMDGSGGARTAWMHQDWNKNFTEKDTGNAGYPTTPPEAYRQIVTALHDAGVHVSTHAIGDRAIDWVVDTYAAALAAKPTRGLRHGIIHDNTPTDHAIDVMARLQKRVRRRLPRVAGDVHLVARRQLRRQPRPRARPAAEAVPHLPDEGHQVGGRIRLRRDAVPGALRAVGVGRAQDAERHLRRDAVRHRGIRGHQDRAALVHDLGRASDVSGRPDRLDRGRQGRRHRGLGPQHVRGPDRRAEGSQVRADAVPREGRPRHVK